jgi:hypothetical protein
VTFFSFFFSSTASVTCAPGTRGLPTTVSPALPTRSTSSRRTVSPTSASMLVLTVTKSFIVTLNWLPANETTAKARAVASPSPSACAPSPRPCPALDRSSNGGCRTRNALGALDAPDAPDAPTAPVTPAADEKKAEGEGGGEEEGEEEEKEGEKEEEKEKEEGEEEGEEEEKEEKEEKSGAALMPSAARPRRAPSSAAVVERVAVAKEEEDRGDREEDRERKEEEEDRAVRTARESTHTTIG